MKKKRRSIADIAKEIETNSETSLLKRLKRLDYIIAKDLRPVGDITQDLEPLLFELTQDHELQHGEVLALIFSWLQIHAPASREQYTEGGSPTYFYGYKK